jgi:hypothetical protein
LMPKATCQAASRHVRRRRMRPRMVIFIVRR